MCYFTSIPVNVKHNDMKLYHVDQAKVLWCSAQDAKGKQYAAAIMADPDADIIEECSIPQYDDLRRFDVPQCNDSEMS